MLVGFKCWPFFNISPEFFASLSLQSHGYGVQFNSVYIRALKSSRSLPSFGKRGRTWYAPCLRSCYSDIYRVIFCHFRSNLFPYCVIPENIHTHPLHDGSSYKIPSPSRNIPSRGVMHNPHPPGMSYFPFHGLNLQHLEIIDRVPLKINCSHLKTQVFIILDLFVIFYKAICISYAGRARLIGSLPFLLVRPAKHARRENKSAITNLQSSPQSR